MSEHEPASDAGGRKRGPKKRAPNACSLKTISKDIRLQALTALNIVGGAKYLAKQAEKNPAAFMALLGKLVTRDDGAANEGVTFLIQTVNVNASPVAGVLSSPIAEHVQPLRLVANGGEVIDVPHIELPPDDDEPAS